MAELSDAQPLFPGSDDIDQLSQIVSAFGELPDCLKTALFAHPTLSRIAFPVLPTKLNLQRYRPKLTEKGIDLMTNMLMVDPSKRITASEALKHPYFDIIKPKVFQMTSTAWETRKNAKMNSIESCTDRNERSLSIMKIGNSKSAEKESILKERVANVFFKFGHKNVHNDNKMDVKMQNSPLSTQHEKGINRIYCKKEKEKEKCVFPFSFGQVGENRQSKPTCILSTKAIPNLKGTQKKRRKSIYMANV